MSIGLEKGENGKFLWPGFGENSRILKWIFERTSGQEHAITTPIGYLPQMEAIDLKGLDIDKATMQKLFKVDRELWKQEVESLNNYFRLLEPKLPEEIIKQLNQLKTRLDY